MARIDVSELLADPDFLDDVTLIRRTSTTGGNGRGTLTEAPEVVQAAIQDVDADTLRRLPEGARPSAAKSIWYRGELRSGVGKGYADVVEFGGVRYQVSTVVEDFRNHGTGFTHAVLRLEAAGV